MKIRSYEELRSYKTFEDRFEYLNLGGEVGVTTFGFDRYLNQVFYKSSEWRSVRNQVILRDEGCDLGTPGHEIFGKLLIHHMNPITYEDLESSNPDILNPNYLITVTLLTHNAIHFGDKSRLPSGFRERTPGDTTLW